MPDQTFYQRYARLAVQVAVPLQPGQRLLIISPPETFQLAGEIATAAYAVGAAEVEILYEDPQVLSLKVQYAAEAALQNFSSWTADALTAHACAGQPMLSLHSPQPHTHQGFDARAAVAAGARNAALEEYGMRRSRVQFSWSVMAVATAGWAQQLRPELPEADALEWLWQVLARLMRLDAPDPVQAWEAHAAHLMQRCAALDALQITQLHFEGPGTDLRLGLPAGHQWFGPLVPSAAGLRGIPNMPTEEISTLPHRLQAEGQVRMTRPLVVHGHLIETMDLTFEGGRVTELHSPSGEALLRSLLGTDEGAAHLGEVALVSEDSRVSREHRTFYSTLIDENASCHLALGRAYPVTLKGGADLEASEFQARGGNHSQVHLDFMVGSPELRVTALTSDGRSFPVMQHGKWV
ncbi:aminopeptidase [Deinococcus marmoris]|uniref:Aminopeptidase S (Leu, Val, Phe, Tyr preference) n=1 Tax=Deinococcus marmoris TaxID=249408 RepID=A0A1U7NVI4_9DEIO|nr:aminopeptidase [Deinococcus marmoris]OLV16931.1 Aminopeptidase S (Leu, Val, Phe, Tyr preference) [Deinococcus marmoris]